MLFALETLDVNFISGLLPRLSTARAPTAAGLLGAEAQHAGAVRALLAPMASHDAGWGNGMTVVQAADALIALFNRLGGGGVADVGLQPAAAQSVTGAAAALQLSSVDQRGLAIARTADAVVGIEFGWGDMNRPGLFYPKGFTTVH